MNHSATRRRLVALAALTVVPTMVAGGSASAAAAAPCFDVNQFLGGAGHHGAGLPSSGIVGAPEVLWTVTSESPMPGSPAIVDGVAYLTDGLLGGGVLRAVDAGSGAELWSVELPGQPFGSSPAMVDEMVFVGDIAGTLTAIDVADRAVSWSVPLASTISSAPAVADGVVIVNAEDTVYAIDPATGATRWSFANGGDGGYTLESSPALVDGVVFATSLDSEQDTSLWALDAATGDELWSYEPPAPGLSTPMYDDGVIYVGGSGGLVAVDAESGDELWSSDVGQVFSAAAVDDELVLAHTGRNLVAVDRASGELLWRADTGGSWSTPTVVDDVVYVGSNGMAFQQSIQLLDVATGTQVARIEGLGTANAPVVVTGGTAYAATGAGLVAIGVPGTSTCSAEQGS